MFGTQNHAQATAFQNPQTHQQNYLPYQTISFVFDWHANYKVFLD